MSNYLKQNISSQYFEAANALRGKNARRRIVAYVESYDDIYFWRSVLSSFENDRRYFEVMLPSHGNLLRGKKSVLMNFVGKNVGPDMIACVDADYDYVMQGCTQQSQLVLDSPYVFHTYAYAIENLQCYAPSLHDVCVGVTLNDRRIFDFEAFFARYSEIVFPLFVWSVWFYRTNHYTKFPMTSFSRVIDLGGFNVKQPDSSLDNLNRKVNNRVRELTRDYPEGHAAYPQLKKELMRLGIQPQETYLFVQGHHLFDAIVAPMLAKVCNLLRQERQAEISRAQAQSTHKRNEMTCYDNTRQDVRALLRRNTGFRQSQLFQRIQADISRYLDSQPPGASRPQSPLPTTAPADASSPAAQRKSAEA